MQIQNILNKNPLVLAPMAGITDFSFRMICKELGAGLVFSEMVSVEALIREHKRTHGMLHTAAAERPVVFQIFGSKPASMAEAAHIVSQAQAFPGGHPQERAVGVVYFLNRYGSDFVDRLIDDLPPDQGVHWVMTI